MIKFLLILVVLSLSKVESFNPLDPNDPVYDRVVINWNSAGELDVEIPNEIDCYAKCSEIDMCSLGICMLGCFDKDHDGGISINEMQDALDKQLYWYERSMTADGKGWVNKFDGKDGTPNDGKISFKEVIIADVSCSDFKRAQDYICKRCSKY